MFHIAYNQERLCRCHALQLYEQYELKYDLIPPSNSALFNPKGSDPFLYVFHFSIKQAASSYSTGLCAEADCWAVGKNAFIPRFYLQHQWAFKTGPLSMSTDARREHLPQNSLQKLINFPHLRSSTSIVSCHPETYYVTPQWMECKITSEFSFQKVIGNYPWQNRSRREKFERDREALV